MNANLAAQLDGVAAALREFGSRIATIAAQVAENETALARRPVEPVRERVPELTDNPNRIVSLAEASRLSSLSPYTLRRHHRAKFLQLSRRRLGMRLCDVLLLAK
jgi:hypothetical protein